MVNGLPGSAWRSAPASRPESAAAAAAEFADELMRMPVAGLAARVARTA